MALGPRDSLDLQTLSTRYASGKWTPAEVIALILRRIDAYPDPAVWISRLTRVQIDAQLQTAAQRKDRGVPQPLFGIPFAVKDNIDVAGHPTTAACPDFAYMPEKTATVVTRLCEAGAILIGKTNLDQFATGLVGTRSPYGACRNPFDPRYISGGSSSGSAVAVAAGLVSFSLGTDTAGSGRVPAAFNNLVGLKPTRGLISTTGLFPACRSLDCISIFALTCGDARQVADIAVEFDPRDPYSRAAESFRTAHFTLPNLRFGVPEAGLQFFGNTEAEKMYRAAVSTLETLGATSVPIDFTPFAEAAQLLYSGPWVAERYAAIKGLMTTRPEALLPVTRSIIGRGADFSAISLFEALDRLATLRREADAAWAKTDVLLVPTAGTIYTRDAVEADPIALNTNLGYYTNFANLMDLCAIAVPNGFQSNGLPSGITFVAPAGSDKDLLAAGESWHHQTGSRMGATTVPLPSTPPES